MSDDERKGDDEIDLKHLQEEIEMVKGWGVRHNGMIEEMKDDIRHFYQKFRDLETGNTGRRTGRSRRGNPQYRPAVGGRRTRGKLRAKSRAKSRKKRRKSRRKKSGGMIREIQLNEVKIGARYGVRVRLPRRGEDYFRGNLISVERNTNPHIRPLVGEDKMYTFDKVQGNGLYSEVELPERWIIKITEYDIPNLNDTDANINVNEFLGGRRKRTRKKRRKSRRKKRRKSRRKRKR